MVEAAAREPRRYEVVGARARRRRAAANLLHVPARREVPHARGSVAARARLVYAAPDVSQRVVSFEYLNRQLVWRELRCVLYKSFSPIARFQQLIASRFN